MNFEDIGRVWREEGTGAYRRRKVESLSETLGAAARLNAAVRQRLRRAAWLIAVPLSLFFAFLAARAPTPAASAGAAVLAVWGLVVAWRYGALGRTAADATLPVRLAVEREVQRLAALERFGRDAKWYRAVLAVGYLLFTLGTAASAPDPRARAVMIVLSVLVLLLVELMIFLARRRGPGRTRALRDDLESWLAGLDGLESATLDRR